MWSVGYSAQVSATVGDRRGCLAGGAGDDHYYFDLALAGRDINGDGICNATDELTPGNVCTICDNTITELAGEGDDTIEGDAGNDVLIGEEGADRLDGGDNDDILIGMSGADTLLGEAGIDVLYGHRDFPSFNYGDANRESLADV